MRVCYTTDAQSLKAQLQSEVKEDGSIRERSCRTPIWKTAWPEDLLLMEKLRRTWQPLRRTSAFMRGVPGHPAEDHQARGSAPDGEAAQDLAAFKENSNICERSSRRHPAEDHQVKDLLLMEKKCTGT